MRTAVIDLGTNSTRLLVADVGVDEAVDEVERRTRVTRLGEGVDSSGRLAPAAMERVLECLGGYSRLIERHGAQPPIAIATSAVRDSVNGQELVDAARARHGIEIRTIDGAEEARLTFLGATSGRRDGEPVLVIDIGGGSTEYVCGRPAEEPDFHVSTQLGSVRQSERHLEGDPPEPDRLAALAEEVRVTLAAQIPARVREEVGGGVAVAGTATSLAAIDQALDPYDPARVHGYELALGACEEMLAKLAALPLAERREVTGLHPDRAPTIVAGVVILVESMRLVGLEAIAVSESDILHGAAISSHRGG